MKNILIGLMMIGLSSTSANAATNLVVNGSFEADIQTAGTWGIYDSLTGWENGVSGGGIELRNNVAGTASDGVNFVELDTTRNSLMYQRINTVIGRDYTLSFDYMKRPDTELSTNGIDWTFGGSNGQANLIDDAIWHTFSTILTADVSPMLLTFLATGTSDSFGTSIDNISVSAVPVPAAVWLFGSALMGLVGVSRRKTTALAT